MKTEYQETYQNNINGGEVHDATTMLAHFHSSIGFTQQSQTLLICLVQGPELRLRRPTKKK